MATTLSSKRPNVIGRYFNLDDYYQLFENETKALHA